ncbi:MAG TPA: alpha/beta family hydrolase [Polyangiaceae bacterium]|nr:alpha/beta family hydrolase [Polyangiaceae bacterium]
MTPDARPLVLFAPGAGAPSSSKWMTAWASRLETVGRVVSFDYPYMLEHRKVPDPLPRLVAAHREALERARDDHEGPVVLAGKSMGSRIGCHVSLEATVDALVCFGYPLRGAGKRAPLRDEVLRALRTPILFVSGTRDPLCPLDELEKVRAEMTAKSVLHVVPGGDHSLDVRKTELRARGETAEQVDSDVLSAVSAFVRDVVRDLPRR